MNAKEIEYVQGKVENEGFDYTFRSYSDFKDIKDKDFHALRIAYVEAADSLAEYIGCE